MIIRCQSTRHTAPWDATIEGGSEHASHGTVGRDFEGVGAEHLSHPEYPQFVGPLGKVSVTPSDPALAVVVRSRSHCIVRAGFDSARRRAGRSRARAPGRRSEEVVPEQCHLPPFHRDCQDRRHHRHRRVCSKVWFKLV